MLEGKRWQRMCRINLEETRFKKQGTRNKVQEKQGTRNNVQEKQGTRNKSQEYRKKQEYSLCHKNLKTGLKNLLKE